MKLSILQKINTPRQLHEKNQNCKTHYEIHEMQLNVVSLRDFEGLLATPFTCVCHPYFLFNCKCHLSNAIILHKY